MPSLFEQVVDCCGLAPAFARRIISEACARAGAAAETMEPSDLIRALPRIEEALCVFLDRREVALKIRAMRRLVQGSWRSFPAVSIPTPEADPPSRKSTP